MSSQPYVFKRDGRKERVQFDKITSRIDKLCYGLDMDFVNPIEVTQKVVQGVYKGVTTVELDNLAAETAAYLTTKHPDYAILAARIAISNLHKETTKSFSAVIKQLHDYVNPKTGRHSPLISDGTYQVVMDNAAILDSAVIYNRDFNYNYFGFKTLERSYLLRINGRVAERPQHMIMRVAVGIHGSDIDRVIETYNLMSERYFTHASPTLFNAGTPRAQMSSCFLVAMKEDSIEGIYDTLKECAMISKTAGGIGLSIHCIRATGMKRVEANTNWSLFCPDEAPGLHEVYGEEFEALYERYEKEGRARRVIPAQKLWYSICEAQIETGNPFMLYKDVVLSAKSNQKNLGTIKSSNLCTEIIEYCAPDETAVCNLASLALPSFIRNGVYDFQKLHDVTKVVTRNLNRVIDVNYYPVPEARTGNFRHRPIGLGVQGLADAFMALRMPFESAEAKLLNTQIFETIYHAAVEASCDLAEEEGPYETWMGSPAQQGILQYDFWGVTPTDLWDWASLKEKVARTGMRNSLLLAPMPTASTSQILGNNECFEAYTSNIYTRRTLAGEFQVVCPWLLRELVDLKLWDDSMKNMIIAHNGSIQAIPTIPDDVKAIYKTVWEISQKRVIDLAADRGAFIDQSQSLNIHLPAPTLGQLTSMHFYGWRKGLKTGMYYLRTRPASQAIQFTVDQTTLKEAAKNKLAAAAAAASQPTSSSPPSVPPPSYSASSISTPAPVNGAAKEVAKNSEKEMDPEHREALRRLEERKLADEKLQCSLENKGACVMCSG